MNIRVKLIMNKNLVLQTSLPSYQSNLDFRNVLMTLINSEFFTGKIEVMADGYGAVDFLEGCRHYGLIVLKWDEH